jgi:hippurate hydrolase
VQEGLRKLAFGIANAHGAKATVEFEAGFPVTVCDPRAVALGQRVTESLFGAVSWQTLDNPIMGAEDFSYVLQKVPGAMCFLAEGF